MQSLYRSKKQNLPLVLDSRLAPYLPNTTNSPSNPLFSRKRSIDLIMEKHQMSNITNIQQIGIYQRPARKTYRPSRTRKADSGYFKDPRTQQEMIEAKNNGGRNRSTQLGDKQDVTWQKKKGDSDFSPYVLVQNRKSHSTSKFKAIQLTISKEERDWVCERLIQNQVYSIEQPSDFS